MTKNTNEAINFAECKYNYFDGGNSRRSKCSIDNCYCDCLRSPDCYFKQLQRLKKENEKVKNFVRHYMIDIDCENWFEKFESRFQEWKADMIKNEAKYKKYLEETKTLIKSMNACICGNEETNEDPKIIIKLSKGYIVDILNKINEVLDER